MKYWEECISESLSACGIDATAEQIAIIARDVEISHENYGMAYPSPDTRGLERREVDELKKKLADEKNKRWCGHCHGRGRIIERAGTMESNSECHKCHGTGKVG